MGSVLYAKSALYSDGEDSRFYGKISSYLPKLHGVAVKKPLLQLLQRDFETIAMP